MEQGKITPSRPAGSKMTDVDMLAKYQNAAKLLQAGRTIWEVAGECSLSTKTVLKIKRAL